MRRVLLAALLAASLSACGEAGDSSEDALLDALAATELLSRRLDYEVDRGSERVAVEITIEDDYRYASELSLGDGVAYREVVYDDALAAQVLDGTVAPLLGAPSDAEPMAPGQWLVDELGAPPAVVAVQRTTVDPIVDAFAYFSYVRDAARASAVTKFDEDALDYRPDEDPFPKPESGIDRYDIQPTRLPDRAAIERARGGDVPEVSDLRKLAVYVSDGRVVAIREAIDVEPFVSGLRRSLNLGDADADELLDAVNELRSSIGQDPIEPRRTTLLVEDHGRELRVDLPEGTRTTLQLHVGDVVAPPSE